MPKRESGQGRLRSAGRVAAIGALLACVLCFAACAAGEAAGAGSQGSARGAAVAVTDMLGRTVEVPEEAERVIGIGSSALRYLAYLEAIDKVVGVEQSELEDSVACSYRHVYHEAFADLPVIGDAGSNGTTPNAEAILQVAPDVIFANVDADTANALQERTGIPVVCTTITDAIFDEELYENLTLMGSIVGADERADELVAYLRQAADDLSARTEGISDVERKSAYAAGITFRGGHGFAGTEAGFAPFALTGVANIADGQGAEVCFDIDLEAVAAAQPDFIFIESGNLSLVAQDYASNPGFFETLEAVRAGNVFTLIPYRFYATNIELALANCYQVGCMVYPDRFADVDPTEKLDEITEVFLGTALSDDLAAQGYVFESVDLASQQG